MTPKVILLATDLSSRGDRAMDRARSLALEWACRLVVVHALVGPATTTDVPSWRAPTDPRDLARRRILRDLGPGTTPDLEIVVERGDPATLITETVERAGAGLVLVGTQREETLLRAMLGSTIGALVRRSAAPVLVVRTRPHGAYRDVVVGTDFSEASRVALTTALALFPRARVSILHALGVPYETIADDQDAAREAVARDARTRSEEFLAATPEARDAVVGIMSGYGAVTTLLDDLAQGGRLDLAVLGTEGRSGLSRLLLGSDAERLLRVLAADTLVVRRPST